MNAVFGKNRQKRDLTVAQQLARGPVDMPFLMLVVMLTVIGVIMVFSASYTTAMNEGSKPYSYFARQAIFAGLGFAAMYVVAKIDYHRYRKAAPYVLLLAILLLVVVLLPGFHTVRDDNVRRWLDMPSPIPDFQPSELAKLGVILYFSSRMARRNERKPWRFNMKNPIGRVCKFLDQIGLWELLPYGGIMLAILILMKKEPHMSGLILILAAAGAIIFAGGLQWRWILAGLVFVVAIIAHSISGTGYQNMRIEIWKDPWAHPQEGGFQIIQSLYAIGSGGLFGVGLGQSRQSKLFLPEPENDFIFSIVCEELGLVGAGLILVLFAMLIIRGYWIAIHARDRFGALLVVGITTLLAVQVFLNIAVVTNLLPTTGISLPFFSYGGTALVIQLAEMGIVLAVSRQIPAPKQG